MAPPEHTEPRAQRTTRVQDHIVEWRSAYYTNAYPASSMPDPARSEKEKERFRGVRMQLIQSLNHNRALEEAVLIGITDGRCNDWADFSSFVTSKAEALGVGKNGGESSVAYDKLGGGQQHRQGGPEEAQRQVRRSQCCAVLYTEPRAIPRRGQGWMLQVWPKGPLEEGLPAEDE